VPILVGDYAAAAEAVPGAVEAGVRAMLAAPLLHEGRLLGAIAVASLDRVAGWTDEDAEALELLAALAAATLVGLERSRLAGVLLAARTVEHEINNRLVLTVGYAELLAQDPALPAELRALANEALDGAQSAAEIVRRLRGLIEVHELDWGPPHDPIIDLARSTERTGREAGAGDPAVDGAA
jgi:GAF domain-containing protein